MANWYCDSAAYTAVPQWSAGDATIVAGSLRRQLATPTLGNERVFRAGGSGTTGGAEPTWNLGKGVTTTDNGITWTEVTGVEAYQGGGGVQWKAPHAHLKNAAVWATAGDNHFVGHTHAETWAGAQLDLGIPSTTTAPTTVLCVLNTGSVPPVSADLRTTGSITTTGGSSYLDVSHVGYMFGLNFYSSQRQMFNQQANTGLQWFDNCTFDNKANSWRFESNSISVYQTTLFANCSFAPGESWRSGGPIEFKNCKWDTTGPGGSNALFDANSPAMISIRNSDLSNFTKPIAYNLGGYVTVKNCRLAVGQSLGYGILNGDHAEIVAIRCDVGAKEYTSEKHSIYGDLTTNTIVVRTGGSNDGVSLFSHKIVTGTKPTWTIPFVGFDIAIWNTVLGNPVNITVEGIADPNNFSALPKNDEIWFETEYLGYGGAPLGSYKSATKKDALATGTALLASTQAWDSAAPARQNSTAYALGAPIKLASNAGRVFFCTTAGTSAGSEPGGYASAIDGGSVTDGTAVFKAGWRFKQTVLLASPMPQMVGPITVQPKMGKPSATLYIDPLITLS